MKIICLSDAHLSTETSRSRLDNIETTGIRKFEYILSYAKQHGINIILTAGDLFHKARSWLLLPKIMDILYKYSDIQLFTVYGQHNLYFYSQNIDATLLGILAKAKLITILSKVPFICDGAEIYGCSYGKEIPTVINKKRSVVNILVIHKEISNRLIPHINTTLAKQVLKENFFYDLILCGDIHKKFIEWDNERIICNAGPMLRREASEDMFDHSPGFFIYDITMRKLDWHAIPHEPAEVVLTRSHIEKSESKENLLNSFIEAIKAINTQKEEKGRFDVRKRIFDKLLLLLDNKQIDEPQYNYINSIFNSVMGEKE